MNIQDRQEIFVRFQAARPNPTTELEYNSPFQLLVSVMLSAQTTDKSVNLATRKFYPKHGTPLGILRLGERGLAAYIRTIGLYKKKARYATAIAKSLIENYGGEIPRTLLDLEKLPGVGRKTANVVLNVAFGYLTIAVDTHVFRVCNRTGIVKGKTVLEVEKKLVALTPLVYRRHAHNWLVLHGRYICTARNPRCHQCQISDLCFTHSQNNSIESRV